MYFGASQYPALRDKTRKERNRIVSAAIKSHAKWVNRRFLIAIAVLLGTGWLYPRLIPGDLSSWHIWTVAICLGALFALYLLYEINGPVFKAVQKHLEHETQPRAPQGRVRSRCAGERDTLAVSDSITLY